MSFKMVPLQSLVALSYSPSIHRFGVHSVVCMAQTADTIVTRPSVQFQSYDLVNAA